MDLHHNSAEHRVQISGKAPLCICEYANVLIRIFRKPVVQLSLPKIGTIPQHLTLQCCKFRGGTYVTRSAKLCHLSVTPGRIQNSVPNVLMSHTFTKWPLTLRCTSIWLFSVSEAVVSPGTF